jgi:hypothetical protein
VKAVLLAAAVVVVGVSIAHAEGPYDGSVPMKCAIQTVMACSSVSCTRGTAQTVLLPPVLTVDVAGRLIGGSAQGRTARITSTGQGPGKLMIAGHDTQTLGNMWGLVVDQKTGAMSGAILSHGDGTLLFGACTAP